MFCAVDIVADADVGYYGRCRRSAIATDVG
jgi:hypothetical protein